MHAKVLVAGAAVALAAAASPAAAAVGGVPVSGRAIQVLPASLAYDAAGRAVVSWNGVDGRLPDATRPFIATAAAPAGGAWARGPRLPRNVVDHTMAVGRGPVAAIVTVRQNRVGRKRSRTSLVLSRWDTRSASLGRSVVLARGPVRPIDEEGLSPTILSPRAGMTADDDVVVTWLDTASLRRRGVWVATLRPDGRLVAPRLLARGMVGYPELRVAPDGSGLLVYARQRAILALRRAPDGRWGPVERVGTAPGWVNQLESWRVTGSGERFAIAAVMSRRGDGVRTLVLTETRTTGGRWYGVPLGEYVFPTTAATSYVSAHPQAVPLMAADGRIRVLWPDMAGGRVRAALTEVVPDSGGVVVGPPALLSGPATDIAIEDAAIRPEGEVAAVWFDTSANGGTPNGRLGAGQRRHAVPPPELDGALNAIAHRVTARHRDRPPLLLVRDYRWQLVRLSDGLKVAARHRFGARAIVSRWTVSCTRRRGRDDVAAADLPAYGPPGDLATVRLQSDPSGGYRLIPAGIAASRRAADPLAGPTLTVRWTGRLETSGVA